MADSGSETPRLDAELLLAHVLNVGRTSILAEPEIPLSEPQSAAFAQLLERRTKGEPVAYIRGIKEFYGLAFVVDSRALIPRPETETLVGIALERVQEALVATPRPPGTPPLLVRDVGTGSGAIAVTLAVEFRRRRYANDVRVLATDSSPEALSLAVENAVAHGVADVIEFDTIDLTDTPDLAPVDLLLANLPYIPTSVVPTLPIAASFEPVAALDGGADGLDVLRRLLAQLPGALAAGGSALLEIGADQADGLAAAAGEAVPGWSVTIHNDMAGRPRVAEIGRPA